MSLGSKLVPHKGFLSWVYRFRRWSSQRCRHSWTSSHSWSWLRAPWIGLKKFRVEATTPKWEKIFNGSGCITVTGSTGHVWKAISRMDSALDNVTPSNLINSIGDLPSRSYTKTKRLPITTFVKSIPCLSFLPWRSLSKSCWACWHSLRADR